MELQELETKLEEANDKAHAAAILHADACATIEYLDEMRKTVLAGIINTCGTDAYNKAEMKARASEQYIEHVEAIKIARHKQLVQKAHQVKWLNEFERLRSILSALKIINRF